MKFKTSTDEYISNNIDKQILIDNIQILLKEIKRYGNPGSWTIDQELQVQEWREYIEAARKLIISYNNRREEK